MATCNANPSNHVCTGNCYETQVTMRHAQTYAMQDSFTILLYTAAHPSRKECVQGAKRMDTPANQRNR